MGKYRIETEDGGVYEVETEDVPSTAASAAANVGTASDVVRRTLTDAGTAALQGTADVLGGIGSGLFKTARGGLQATGLYDRMSPEQQVYLDKLATAPQSIPGHVGQFVEQGAEFLIPGAAAGRYVRAIGNPLLRAGAGMAAEGIGSGLVAGAQSGGNLDEALAAGAAGATLSGLASGLKAMGPRIGESAVELYQRALNPTKDKTKAMAEQVVPELLNRRQWIGSMKGTLAKTQARIGELGQQIDDAWKNLGQQGATADVEPILQRLNDYGAKNFTVKNTAGAASPIRGAYEGGRAELDAIIATIEDASTVNPVTGNREMPVESLRQLRQTWDKVAKKSGYHTKEPGDLPSFVKGVVNGETADIARSELAKAYPDLAALNKEITHNIRFADVVRETQKRRVGQQGGLGKAIQKGAGAAAGSVIGGAAGGPVGAGVGAVVGPIAAKGLETLVTSNAWRTLSAVQRARIADAIAAGNRGAAEFYLLKALKGAGLAGITERFEPAAGIPVPAVAR